MINVNQDTFEELCWIMLCMHKSKKEYAADAYTDVLLKAIECGPAEFAIFIQQQLAKILSMPLMQHFIEEGIHICSLEEAVNYHKRTEEIIKVINDRLSMVSPDLYAASPTKSSMHYNGLWGR